MIQFSVGEDYGTDRAGAKASGPRSERGGKGNLINQIGRRVQQHKIEAIGGNGC